MATSEPTNLARIGLAVIGQNLALNIAEKGFQFQFTIERAKQEGNLPIYVIKMLVKADSSVNQTIKTLSAYLEKGGCIIDGGNEWYENTELREKTMNKLGFLYLGMGVSTQRDYFGAHTYERIDMEGSFHTDWFKIAKQSRS
ncbi:decarboxylating 6-phosphogluconate dehydrogenase [Medicago truncatula]|uniref:phosphogluconate dehydrogenase (NADP(+)-dependent, decarboxylating) n=1 Tax=Medicago truncatula TaxID=3880 RepID=G7ZV04_MEDTR|nr:decarboxylating 6-phosphogluconate dehydrogenase [Medicago truncatula]